MAASNTRARPKSAKTADGDSPRPWDEFLGVGLLALGILTLGGLFSYQAGAGTWMGPIGHLLAGALYAAFGMASYLVALGIFVLGIQALLGRGMTLELGDALGFSLATLAGCVLLHISFPEYRVHGYTAGGLGGELLGEVCLGLLHPAGTYLVASTVLVLGLLASTPLSIRHLGVGVRFVGQALRLAGSYLSQGALHLWHAVRTEDVPVSRSKRRARPPVEEDEYEEDEYEEDEEYEECEEYEEYEEDEEDEEDDDEGSVATPEPSRARPRARRSRKSPSDKADSQRARATPPAGDEPEATQSKAPKAGGARAEGEMPEIVVGAQNPDGPKPKKAPPPRPEELARTTAAPVRPVPAPAAPKRSETGIPGVIRLTPGPYQLPPSQLFEAAQTSHAELDRNFVLEQAQRLVAALAEFRIRGKVTKIHPGPVITRYEFKPEPGVKLSKIESLENDIAMALEALRIRILAPIPGKATVGFEVPNKQRETVYIKEILEAENFGGGNKLPMALGKDITGHATATCLTKAPHLLVAGATGSGKSVGVNAMICSLLYTCSPEDVRMIMIDPKMLELSIYEGIPHLLLPVVTDPEKASLALRWAVQEMERRYALLSDAQVRDIAGYNRKLSELQTAWDTEKRQLELAAAEVEKDAREYGEDGADGTALSGVSFDADGHPMAVIGGQVDMPERPTRLPYIVVIIDEFADLMMVASKEVEQCVARIAAKARAAGIHLIVATQRPSVDVITGTIKNNFPSRIAFQVTSDADSRTILDGKGAKQLLGMGDMLHMDRGMQPQRVHGCYVSEDEILKVVEFVKRQAKPVYNMDIVRKRDDEGELGDPDEGLDPMYDRAVEIVAEAQKVSTSMIQRRLGIGYNRAAKIVDAMEQRGVIGPARGTTPREVYVSA